MQALLPEPKMQVVDTVTLKCAWGITVLLQSDAAQLLLAGQVLLFCLEGGHSHKLGSGWSLTSDRSGLCCAVQLTFLCTHSALSTFGQSRTGA